MKARKLFYLECRLAGRMFHDATEVWDKLGVGTKLDLYRDVDNRHDPYAVAVIFRQTNESTWESEDYLLGFVPRDCNKDLAQFLEMGWGEIFECRISKFDPTAPSHEQIRITIRILRNENVQS